MPPPSSSFHSAAGSRGAPATSAGCDKPALETPRNPGARTKDNTSQQPQRPTHTRPHPLRRSSARTDDAFPLAVRGANAMAGARPHRAEPGAPSALPTKGGAMRIRIALGTAVAVIVVAIPSVLTSLITSDPAQGAYAQHAVRINDTLMSYSQARQVAQEITYASAVEAAQQAT